MMVIDGKIVWLCDVMNISTNERPKYQYLRAYTYSAVHVRDVAVRKREGAREGERETIHSIQCTRENIVLIEMSYFVLLKCDLFRFLFSSIRLGFILKLNTSK